MENLENIACPKCKEKSINKKEERNLNNLVFGLGIFTAMSVGTEMEYLIGLGAAGYLIDFPFGPEEKYSCKKCDYEWDC